MTRVHLEADAIVIGSGAGGSTAAATLVERGFDTLMLEEGLDLPHEKVPQTSTESMLQMWRSAGLTPAMGRTPVAYAEGRCVGGGTEINSAIFQHAPPQILDKWAREINDFAVDDLAPYYAWAENVVNVSMHDGELGPPSSRLMEAGRRQGWKTESLPRGQKGCVGTNLCSFGCPTGGKQSMSTTLLRSAKASGLRLEAGVRIKRLVTSGNRVVKAVGERVLTDGVREAVEVTGKHFFVAAGTIHSAALLQRSGLKSVRSSAFQLHPTIKLMAAFDEAMEAYDHRLPLYAITEFLPEYRMGGSVTTGGTFGMALAEGWVQRKDLLADIAGCVGYYAMIRPDGWGRIRHIPFCRDPYVSYHLTPADIGKLVRALGQLAEALFSVGATRLYPSLSGHKGWGNVDAMHAELAGLGKRPPLDLMSIHLFSSASPSHPHAENDSFGRLNNVENLVITDGSIVPSAPCVNPQATIMAFARRALDRFTAGA